MATRDEKVIRIDLTADQKQQLKALTDKDAQAIELTVRELEERIAPGVWQNHNETFLSEPL
jgi:hypothetical protein